MQKFFVNSDKIEDNIIKITDSDVNHIVNVLRLKVNDEITICNKDNSNNYICKIVDIKYENEKLKDEIVKCKIIEKIDNTNELNFEVEAFQGLPKFDKMELIIQKLVEIGVTKITPVNMERCIVKLNEKDSDKKLERWNKISEVASKQSKRDRVPSVEKIINIKTLCEKVKEYDIFIVAYEEEKQNSLKDILNNIKNKEIRKIGFLVGPEGGISNKEIEILKSSGAKIITLGKRILRTETAPIVIASNIVYEFDEN